jgi:hypothetical protein
MVEIGEESAPAGEVRQNLRFQAVAVPVRGGFFLEDKEASIDPGVADDGFLCEAFDPSSPVELKRTELRTEGDGGDGGQSAAGVMGVKQGGEIDVAEAISVGGEELIANVIETGEDAIAGIGFGAGVEDFDLPIGKAAIEVVEEHLLAVASSQDEAAEALAGIDTHEMNEDRTPIDGHHGLGKVFGEGVNARAFATAKNDDFEVPAGPYFLRHELPPMQRMYRIRRITDR